MSKAMKTPDEVKTDIAVMDDMYAGEDYVSHDEIGKEDYAVPRLTVIEALSPQLDESSPKFISEARRGQICDTVEGKIFKSIDIIPVLRKTVFLEWIPRSESGGFVAAHSLQDGSKLQESCMRDENGPYILPNGHELERTMEFYVLYRETGTDDLMQPAVISMSRTRLQEGRNLNNKIDNRMHDRRHVKPMYQLWTLGTAIRKGQQGDSYVWKIGEGKIVPEIFGDETLAVIAAAKTFLDAIVGGTKGADYTEGEGDVLEETDF